MNNTFCIAPWVHVHSWANGDVLPCCVSRHDDDMKFGNLQTHTLKEVYNSDNIKEMRLRMMTGKKSPHCSRCYRDEEYGFDSLRLRLNRDYKERHIDMLDITNDDGSIDTEHMRIVYWDMRFSNLCNMKCRTCNTTSSSKWYEDDLEISKHIGHPAPAQKFIKIRNDMSSLIDEIRPQIDNIEEIYFAGGESIIMDEQWTLLDEFVAKEKFNVRLKYQTNMSVLKFKDRNILDVWRKFPNLNIGLSLDASGALAEYLRPGASWDTIEDNIRRIRTELPNANLEIGYTASALNITDIVRFYKYAVEEKLISKWYFYINLLEMPTHYHVNVLPREVLDDTILEIRELISNIRNDDGMDGIISQFESLIKVLKGPSLYQTEEWNRFCNMTRLIDNLRSESIYEHLPWLANYIDEKNT